MGLTLRAIACSYGLKAEHGEVLRDLLRRSILLGFLAMSVQILLLEKLEYASTYGFERLLPPRVLE